jgi:hypothetical protein
LRVTEVDYVNKEHLAKVWSWLAVVSVLFVATSIVSLQGGTEFVGRLLGDKGGTPVTNPAGIGYFGAIVGGGVFLLASVPFLVHVRRHGERWHARVPVVWLEGLDTAAWEGKAFQICVLLLLVCAPAVGILRCMQVAELGDICEQDTPNIYSGKETNLFAAPSAKQGNQMRLRRAGSGNAPCTAGVELFPRSWTPIFFYVIPSTGLGIMALAVILLVVPRNSRTSDPAKGGSTPADMKDVT